MKKIKISILAVIAIMMGIAGSAFTEISSIQQKSDDIHFIEYRGMDNSNAELQASENWYDLGSDPSGLTCGKTSGIVCYVEFNGDLASFQAYVSNKTLAQLQGAGIIQEYRNP